MSIRLFRVRCRMEGWRAADVAQAPSYVSTNDPADTAQVILRQTRAMWDAAVKPNFVGKFGASSQRNHPEIVHDGIRAVSDPALRAWGMGTGDQGFCWVQGPALSGKPIDEG